MTVKVEKWGGSEFSPYTSHVIGRKEGSRQSTWTHNRPGPGFTPLSGSFFHVKQGLLTMQVNITLTVRDNIFLLN